MKTLLQTVLASVFLGGCAAVYTDASDANQVTFLNSSGESMEQLSQKAQNYCAQYGKTATFRNADTQLVVVFDCKVPR